MTDPHGSADVDAMIKALGQDTLFVVERSIDSDVVVYQAKMNEDRTELVGIHMFWTKLNNWAEIEAVSETAKRVIYGVQKQRIKRGLFRIQVNCLSGGSTPYFIDLHIKKSGAVIPKVLIQGKECTLKKIYVDIIKMPPGIKGLWVHGTFDGETISEKLQVGQDLIDRVDLSDFMPGLGL